MNWKICWLVLAGMVLSAGTASVVSVPAGQTHTLNVADSAANAAGNVVDLGANATLKLVDQLEGVSGFAVYTTSTAPTGSAADWMAAVEDEDANFTWETFNGVRPNVHLAEGSYSATPHYGVLYSAKWHVPSDGNYGFFLAIDDFGYLEIDGEKILSSENYCQELATNDVALTAGWHDLRIVIANGSAGLVGAVSSVSSGVAYSPANELLTKDTVATKGTRFSDPGDRTVLKPVLLENVTVRPFMPVRVHVAATNGAVTVDATDCGQDVVDFQDGGLRVQGGALTVVGAKQISFGSAGPTALTIDYPLFDVEDAVFTADGAAGFVLTNQVTAMRLPPETSCASTIARDAMVAVRGTNTLARFCDDQGALNLIDWNLYILENTAVPEETPIRVGAGRTLRYKLCRPVDGWGWYGQGGSATNAVELLDPTASLHLTLGYAFKFYGSIFGVGDLWQDGGSKESRAEIYAACSQTGTVHVTANGTLVFCDQATPGCPTNTVFLGKNATLGIHPAEYETRPTTASVHRVTGDNIDAGCLYAGKLQTFEIAQLEATTIFYGSDETSRYVIDEAVWPAGIIVEGDVQVALRKSADDGSSAVRVRGGHDGATTTALELAGEDVVLQKVTAEAACTLVLSGTGVVNQLMGPGTIRLAPRADIQFREVDSQLRVDVSAGRMTLLPPSSDWRDKVLLWLDPSETNTLRSVVSQAGNPQVYTNGYRLIDAWFDRRAEQRELFLLNNRMWTMGYYDLQPQVYPYLVTEGGPNGLPYISCGTYQQKVAGVGPNHADATEARRLQVWKGEVKTTPKTAAEAYTSLNAAWVVMVFGSSRGGGLAMLGSSDKAYERAGTTLSDSVSKTNFDLYLEGVSQSPTTAKFNGGWQLLSFAGNAKINALIVPDTLRSIMRLQTI